MPRREETKNKGIIGTFRSSPSSSSPSASITLIITRRRLDSGFSCETRLLTARLCAVCGLLSAADHISVVVFAKGQGHFLRGFLVLGVALLLLFLSTAFLLWHIRGVGRRAAPAVPGHLPVAVPRVPLHLYPGRAVRAAAALPHLPGPATPAATCPPFPASARSPPQAMSSRLLRLLLLPPAAVHRSQLADLPVRVQHGTRRPTTAR